MIEVPVSAVLGGLAGGVCSAAFGLGRAGAWLTGAVFALAIYASLGN